MAWSIEFKGKSLKFISKMKVAATRKAINIKKAESRGTKMELRHDNSPTYSELNINKKDASRWQQMVEHEEEIKEKVAGVIEKGIVTILQLHIFCFDVIFVR